MGDQIRISQLLGRVEGAPRKILTEERREKVVQSANERITGNARMNRGKDRR